MTQPGGRGEKGKINQIKSGKNLLSELRTYGNIWVSLTDKLEFWKVCYTSWYVYHFI